MTLSPKDRALSDGLYHKNPEEVRVALNAGADPYFTGYDTLFCKPALFKIVDAACLYTNKLDFFRPLVEAGNDFDLIRERSKTDFDDKWFDKQVWSMGALTGPKEGDSEAAGFLLAHMVAYDLEKGRRCSIPADSILAGVGPAFKTPGSIGENTRQNDAQTITRHQHALVDYVATSNDPVAAFLRTCVDYPDANMWTKKINPIDPDQYSRPSPQYIQAIKDMGSTCKDLVSHWDNYRMGRVLLDDAEITRRELNTMQRSWKPDGFNPS